MFTIQLLVKGGSTVILGPPQAANDLSPHVVEGGRGGRLAQPHHGDPAVCRREDQGGTKFWSLGSYEPKSDLLKGGSIGNCIGSTMGCLRGILGV